MIDKIIKFFLKRPWIIILAVIGAWIIYPIALKTVDSLITQSISHTSSITEEATPTKTELENIGLVYGTYGDSYGSLNTLFSGLAFAMLILSLLMQREELQAQRKELEAQRKEIQESNKIAEGQREITKQQGDLIKQQIIVSREQNLNFVLFQYFEKLDSTINGMSVKARFGNNQLQGFEIFKDFSKELLHSLPKAPVDITDNQMYSDILNDIRTQYIQTTDQYSIKFEESLLLENILIILRYIKKNEQFMDHKQAIQTFLAHVNIDVLLCLAWISILGQWELKKFIEEYSLLRNIYQRVEPDYRLENIKIFFKSKAFYTQHNI